MHLLNSLLPEPKGNGAIYNWDRNVHPIDSSNDWLQADYERVRREQIEPYIMDSLSENIVSKNINDTNPTHKKIP